MATSLKKDIHELFTFPPSDPSPRAVAARKEFLCPILNRDCIKNNDAESEENDPQLRGGLGVCSVYHSKPKDGLRNTTIVCPVRLYGNNYNALRGLAADLLEGEPNDVLLYTEWELQRPQDGIVLIGKHHGGERGTGVVGTFDWLAVRREKGQVKSYAGIEVQAIDITGNYRAARRGYLKGDPTPPPSEHNLNWENVNKRIVPQLMRKGTYLRKLRNDGAIGIGFLVDANVFQKVQARLSSPLESERGGDFVVHAYALAEEKNEAGMHALEQSMTLRTSVEQLSKKFVEIGDDIRPIKLWLSSKFAN